MGSSSSIAVIRNWEPNPGASFTLALIAALLALTVFLFLLHQPELLETRPDTVSISLVKHVPVRESLQKSRHRQRIPPQKAHTVPVKPRIETAASATRQSLDLSIPPLPFSQPSFEIPKAGIPDRNLDTLLNEPGKPASAIQEKHAFRNINGETLVKVGGECGRVQSIQMSPSPSNKATIGFLTDCPGEYRPGLGDQLLDWARKKQDKSAEPPP